MSGLSYHYSRSAFVSLRDVSKMRIIVYLYVVLNQEVPWENVHTWLMFLRSCRLSAIIPKSLTRSYAKKSKGGIDPKKEVIRRALYPSTIRNRATPTGTWRRDVGRAIHHAIPSVQAHDTIERAWLLHRRHLRKRREAEIQRKFDCMNAAMTELQQVDNFLYIEANKKEDAKIQSSAEQEVLKTLKGTEILTLEARIRGLFPRELRIPVDTPPKSGWNYDWRPFPRPL